MEQALAEKLRKRLAEPLPGEMAHQRMAMQGRIERARQVPDNHRASAVLMVLYWEQGSWKFPLIKRPEYDGVHSGQMAFPGGKKEEQDRDLIHTALRETEEEIGVKVPTQQVIGTLSNLYIPPSNMLVTPVIGLASGKPSYQRDPAEVAKVVDIALADLRNPAYRQTVPITVMNQFTIQAPSFQIAGETIWGATAMMLSEFLHIWEEL